MPYNDPFSQSGLQDPIGAGMGSSGGDPAADPAAVAAQAQALQQPISGVQTPPLLESPTLSDKLLNLGIGMINADHAGLGLGGSIAYGLKAYSDTIDDYHKKARQARMDSLAEYELMGRIQDRQMTQLAMQRRVAGGDMFKKAYPDLADLYDADPDVATKLAGERLKPKDRKIIDQGGIQYYADTGEKVLPNVVVRKEPFAGNAMDAQVANILLSGDSSSPEYLAAYNIAKQPKVSLGPDGSPVTVTPDMSAYKRPAAFSYQSIMGDQGGIALGDPKMSSVEGFEISEGARPTAQDAKAVKEISQARMTLEPLFADREALISSDPSPAIGSSGALKMEQNTAQIALKLKGLEQTGALDKGSVDVMMQAIGDPVNRGIDPFSPISSTRTSMTKAKGGAALQNELLSKGKQYLDTTMRAAAESRGYRIKPPTQDQDPNAEFQDALAAAQAEGGVSPAQRPDLTGIGGGMMDAIDPNAQSAAPMPLPSSTVSDPIGANLAGTAISQPKPAAGVKGTASNPYTPTTKKQYDSIPSGKVYIDPDDNKPHVKG